MTKILTTVAVALVVLLVFQTYESARSQGISATCAAAEVEKPECVSLGPIGTVNVSGVRFWITKFIHHGGQLPQATQNAVSKQRAKMHY